MNLIDDDIKRLAFEVRRFLGKGDLMTRLGSNAKLCLEFPTHAAMYDAHSAIMLALHADRLAVGKPTY